ncbi:MAG: CDGSH iron-sulfur domain-containing protein [Deltaproteobacteria bacterium]|nr:CDGSH iron-sulfur domain-containing protein [Deltaproteobacteria bacterium]
MKGLAHAVAGVLGFLLVVTFLSSTLVSELFTTPETVATVKKLTFRGMFLLIPALLVAGGSGVSLLGTRTDSLALVKQKRGPIAFMTSLLVVLPSAFFLSRWSAAGTMGGLFYGVQAVEVGALGLCAVMIGRNIRDGLALTGRISGQSATGRPPEPGIAARDGGPLVVTAMPRLTASDGTEMSTKPVAALCRCGASRTKPYCDGSHNTIGFDSKPKADRTKDEILVYEGAEITVHYNRLLCSHAAECGTRLKAVFDSSRTPWIVPDNGSAEEIEAVVRACPSGALRSSAPGGAPQHIVPGEPGVTIEKNGPLRILGVRLDAPRLAEGASPDKFVLCRCGQSKNKPYCDGSHFDVGWTDEP